jgi:hypothetical protein
MISAAEEILASPDPNGRRKPGVWADEHGELHQGIMAHRGYSKGDGSEYGRCRSSEAPTPPRYGVRALGDGAELLERCCASGPSCG